MVCAVAEKPDSQEICFVPDGDYASFVERKEPAVARAGAIVDERAASSARTAASIASRSASGRAWALPRRFRSMY